jgi:hypothetical protein
MNNSILKGFWKYMAPAPSFIWRRMVAKRVKKARAKLDFMTEDHHKVRNFVIEELPKAGVPLSPETIAGGVGLNRTRVVEILEELEKGMVFLFRNDRGEVAWAYPVTVDRTPHRLQYSTGEQGYAA